MSRPSDSAVRLARATFAALVFVQLGAISALMRWTFAIAGVRVGFWESAGWTAALFGTLWLRGAAGGALRQARQWVAEQDAYDVAQAEREADELLTRMFAASRRTGGPRG